MERVYAKAVTLQKWLRSKDSCKKTFMVELESVLTTDHVRELYKNIMDQEYKKLIVDER